MSSGYNQSYVRHGLLKGTVSRDFSSPGFFHQTTSPGLNGHDQKIFRIFPNIHGVIRIRN
jgi:hypothetical protein